MSPFLIGFTLVVALLIALGLHRAWDGPTVFDRLVAVALVTVNGVVVIVLLGFIFDRLAFFLDIALAYALLAFILPIAVSRFFEERERRTELRDMDEVEP
jgi:multicomponent Na+:H+ antiporter subunit F